jgi:hypothetical protein
MDECYFLNDGDLVMVLCAVPVILYVVQILIYCLAFKWLWQDKNIFARSDSVIAVDKIYNSTFSPMANH